MRVDIPEEVLSLSETERWVNERRLSILALVEVEVLSRGKNVALGGKASQSSTGWNLPASNAIDNNKDTYSFSKDPEGERNPWWEVDLGDTKVIDKVVLWNHMGWLDRGHRLSHARVQILDENRKTVWTDQIGKAARENTLMVNPDADKTVARVAPATPPPAGDQPAAEETAKLDAQLAEECAEFKTVWDAYTENAGKIKTEFQPKFDALNQQYVKALETLLKTVQNQGNLEKAQAADSELFRFETKKTVPPKPDENEIAEIKTLQANYNRAYASVEKDMNARLVTLKQKYGQALERLQTDLVKAGKLNEATGVKKARERAK